MSNNPYDLAFVKGRMRAAVKKVLVWELPYSQELYPNKDINDNGLGLSQLSDWSAVLYNLEKRIRKKFPHFAVEDDDHENTFAWPLRKTCELFWERL